MQRFTTLDTVEQRVWRRLVKAAANPGHPYRALTFGTVQAERPHLRTVILRSADVDARRLAFHTDRRSQKVDDIRDNDRIAWLAWDPDRREQIRLQGTASVHVDDERARRMWEAEDTSSLRLYLQAFPPGTTVESPGDGHRSVGDGEGSAPEEVAKGWPNFAVIRTRIDGFEWLHLHPDGHDRARFQYSQVDQAFEGTWVAP